MRTSIQLNLHRGLDPDDLTRKYRAAREAAHSDDLDESGDDWDEDYYDDYWDPQRGRGPDDHLVLGSLEEALGFARRRPKLGELLPGALARAEPVVPAPREVRPSHGSDALGEAVFAHVERVVARARAHEFPYGEEIEVALARVNGGLRGLEEVLARFQDRPGPVLMALLFAPFWVRPLWSWQAPEGDDTAVTRSLVEHLFQIHAVPRALQQPWLVEGLPSLKWVTWLILLGQGGNLHRAARLFGWSVGKRFTHHFAAAPDHLTALEACVWAEVARLGGERRDLERLLRNPAYAIDPTEVPGSTTQPSIDDGAGWSQEQLHARALHLARTRAFWLEAVAWLVQRRAELTDEAAALVLAWAMHEHTESLRQWPVPGAPFRWQGRESAPAHAAALEYRRQQETPYAALTWRARGLDWETGEGAPVAWTVRELTSSQALAEESLAMHHCVASYGHRCAQGRSAIFSLCSGGLRKITVELDPTSHRIVQARGACNRAATSEEQAVLARWLSAKSPGR
jgi:hypothetical protein